MFTTGVASRSMVSTDTHWLDGDNASVRSEGLSNSLVTVGFSSSSIKWRAGLPANGATTANIVAAHAPATMSAIGKCAGNDRCPGGD